MYVPSYVSGQFVVSQVSFAMASFVGFLAIFLRLYDGKKFMNTTSEEIH
jgi:hypothetical protein